MSIFHVYTVNQLNRQEPTYFSSYLSTVFLEMFGCLFQIYVKEHDKGQVRVIAGTCHRGQATSLRTESLPD